VVLTASNLSTRCFSQARDSGDIDTMSIRRRNMGAFAVVTPNPAALQATPLCYLSSVIVRVHEWIVRAVIHSTLGSQRFSTPHNTGVKNTILQLAACRVLKAGFNGS
jgi:hypothetical protein